MEAIRTGVNRFEERWKTKVDTSILLEPQTPVGEPCLQIIDYLNWAVYRAFVRQEMRYYQFIESKVSLLIDLYDTENYPNNWYNQKNPFDINKTSPL